MDDPKSVEMPAMYGGEFWYPESDVHTNSSIGNLWFSMLVDGKQGVNEAGISFNVPGIGMDKAIEIAFSTNQNYLTSTSNYHDFYQHSLDAAEELFGAGAPEVVAVEEAWKAVGLPASNQGGPGIDLSIEKSIFTFNQLCGLDQYFPVTVKVTNKGTQPYLPAMNAVLHLSTASLNTYDYTIDEPIQPGQILTVTIDDWFLVNSAEFYTIDVELEFTDEVPWNNITNEYFNVHENSSTDLSLDFVAVQRPDCFVSSHTFNFIIANHTCTVVPAGTILGLSIQNESGTTVWSEDYELTEDLEAFGSLTTSHTAILSISPQEVANFYLDFEGDLNTTDNMSADYLPFSLTIAGDYLNEFDGDPLDNGFLLVDSWIAPNEISYLGESYFGSTGLSTDSELFVHCPNYEDNFTSAGFYSPVVSTIRACVDHAAFDESLLSFDLRIFRNDSAMAEGFPYSSMLQAKWAGNENGKFIIANQPEGLSQYFEIPLPPHFKGELELSFYTEIGQWMLDEEYFNTDDVILMDNLQLQAISTGTDEVAVKTSVRISPNPTNRQITVTATEPFNNAILLGLDGRVVRQEKLNGPLFELNLSDLKSGLYYLHLQSLDGKRTIEKVVIMH